MRLHAWMYVDIVFHDSITLITKSTNKFNIFFWKSIDDDKLIMIMDGA
jgi:hypothetical protein